MVEQPRWVQGQATEICGRFLGRTVACLAENVVSCFRLRKVFLDRGHQFRTSNVAWEFCYSMSFSETCGCVAI